MDIVAKHRALSRMLYLNGAFAASDGATYPVINPATEDVIGEVAETTEREIEAAIGFATAAQRKW
jgi:acyl-CoA reductase-like NAD-dependent aldehyde dehydrogenase